MRAQVITVEEVGALLETPAPNTVIGIRDRAILETCYSTAKHIKQPKVLPTSVLDHDQLRAILDGIDTTTAIGYR